MLKQRLITALILIPIVIALIIFLPPSAFCLITMLVTLAAAWEWTNLMELKSLKARLSYLGIALFLMIDALFIPAPLIFAIAFAWWLIAIVAILCYPRYKRWSNGILWRGLMGFLVLIPCWAAINYIRIQGDGL